MGGCCCCCASESTEQNSTPAYFHRFNLQYPVSEEHEPLSSHISTVSAHSTGILVDTNLDTSVPDTYRSPPAPIPFGTPPTPSNQEIPGNKVEVTLQTTNTNVVEGTNLQTKLKSLNSDGKAEINIELAASKESENENSELLKKSVEPFVPSLQYEEDVCPTCLEEYDSENPKIITGCDHHFHLACILEWMERSDTCPICDQEMSFSPFTGE